MIKRNIVFFVYFKDTYYVFVVLILLGREGDVHMTFHLHRELIHLGEINPKFQELISIGCIMNYNILIFSEFEPLFKML